MPSIELELRRTLAGNLRAYRKMKGLSQEELASKCNLHRTYIGSVERCERNVTLGTLCSLSRALNITVPNLLLSRKVPANDIKKH
ncbi:MAG: helix-turn-helix transcriptional regulator [Chitinispirillaceae bacterium]|jgi:transcriptional regulator with XRE-family HTH domain